MTISLQAGLAATARLNGAAVGMKALVSATHTESTTNFSMAAQGRPGCRADGVWGGIHRTVQS